LNIQLIFGFNHSSLDLTAANHAFLLEPQWNPMIEEQAIARVYRLRQLKPVTIRRFVMKNTWEQRVIKKQERKRVLADLILGQESLKKGENGKQQLAVCHLYLPLTPFADLPIS
jgi:SNF2 family DNA or RNA helicase